MTLRIVIRDDDTSYFTESHALELVYQPLWQRHLPVCLSIIPAHFSDKPFDYFGRGLEHDPNIPYEYRGSSRHYVILDNEHLCEQLQVRVSNGLVEPVLHGFSHKFHEFALEDRRQLMNLLNAGSAILGLLFPASPPTTFVAPYDYLSAVATELLLQSGYNICTPLSTLKNNGILTHKFEGDILSVRATDGQFSALSYGAQLVLTSDNYFFNDLDSPDECLRNANNALEQALSTNSPFFICTNHYWQFSDPTSSNSSLLLKTWYRFLEELLATPEVEIVTFSDLIAQLCEN